MMNRYFKILVIIILSITVEGAFAQLSTNKVKIKVIPIPVVMNAGNSYDINVRITNISDDFWNTSELVVQPFKPFIISKISNDIIIPSGRAGYINIRITAPRVADIYALNFIIMDGKKTLLEIYRKINVTHDPLAVYKIDKYLSDIK